MEEPSFVEAFRAAIRNVTGAIVPMFATTLIMSLVVAIEWLIRLTLFSVFGESIPAWIYSVLFGLEVVTLTALAGIFIFNLIARNFFGQTFFGQSVSYFSRIIPKLSALSLGVYINRPSSLVGLIVEKSAARAFALATAAALTASLLLVFGRDPGAVPWVLFGCALWGGLDATLTLRRLNKGVYGDADYELRELVGPLVTRIQKGGDPGDPNRLFPERGNALQDDPIDVPGRVPV